MALPSNNTHPASTAPSANILARMRRFLPYFGTSAGNWVLVAVSAMVAAGTEPFIPALLKPLLDRGFQRGELELWTVPASLLLLFGVRGLAGYVSQVGLSRITNDGLVRLRSAMFDKVLRAELALFHNQSSSALSNTLVFEVQTGAAMLVNSLLSLTRNGLTLLALTGYLLYLNWKLTLIVAAMFPAVAWVMRVLSQRLHWLTKANQEAHDQLAYVVEENVLAHREIRLYAAQASQQERFQALCQSSERLALKATYAGAAMTPLTQMLAAIALSAVISIALVQSSSSGTSVGGFVAFVTAMLMIIAPIRQLTEVSGPITRGLAALEKGLDLLECWPDEASGTYQGQGMVRGQVEFRQVTVAYPDSSTPAIDHLSLQVMPGETVALVGSSGSGKTTLVNLLPRFVHSNAGSVLIDGHELSTWSVAHLRSQIAYVGQNVVMLNDSIAANVALGLALDRSRVQAALDSANLLEFVGTLPRGMDTVVGHNAMQLSGGQRQRLAVARAIYKNAPILILDEATSALDTESERAIQTALQRLMTGRTTLVVAHRLSTIAHADRIVVMEGGRMVEQGSHASLLQAEGRYARLYRLGQQSKTDFIADD